MINTLKHQYRRISPLNKLLLWIAFFLGVFVTTFRFIHAENIPFEANLSTMFTRLNTWYYSNAHFTYGGNNFVGIIFWQSTETLSTPQPISINGWAQAIQCTGHLRGIYYNNQRGRRIWPLDTGNLAILSGQWTGYETMTMDNGFFTSCTGVSWWYVPLPNEVYGQIDHTLTGGQTFSMFAGIDYNFTGNSISWVAFAHTLWIETWWVHAGHIFDTNGWIAQLGMNVPWCQGFTSSPSEPPAITIAQGSGIALTCYGANVTGYIISIWSGINIISSNIIYTGASSYTWTTWYALVTGNYVASCTVLWTGLTGPHCAQQISFHVGVVSWICDPNFQWNISFLAYSGSTIYTSWLTYFTNKTGIIIQWSGTSATNYTLSWGFIGSPLTGTYTGTTISGLISLLSLNQPNYFAHIYTTWSCVSTGTVKTVYVDTLAPTTPIIASPSNGAYLCPSTPLTTTRSASTDSWAGLSHYRYEVYSNSGMITGLVISWTTTTTGATITVSALPLWTYYMRILAVDNLNTTSISSTVSFTTSSLYCSSSTGILIVTPTLAIKNANLDTLYRSDPILILGLTWPTLLTITKGMLFVNTTTGGNGTTGMVTSNDTIYIEMISSTTYNTTVTWYLSIAWQTWTFTITTKRNNCSLSASEKLIIENIYEELKDEYDNDISKYTDFLTTFQSMVDDESDLSNNCNLDYLLSLIEDDFWSDEGIDTSNHITPNCKEYSIGYDNNQSAYYAPEMMTRYYFINRESLIRHLDYYNPGDCHINTYGNNLRTSDYSDPMRHIAPNGKIYHLIWQYGGFSATEFTSAKYFDSMDGIISYIDLKNPAKEIWTHTVDNSFNPIVYAGPNGKEYKIFKTDRWFMSYKLMKVKYYTTLTELKSYIDRNNPSKR